MPASRHSSSSHGATTGTKGSLLNRDFYRRGPQDDGAPASFLALRRQFGFRTIAIGKWVTEAEKQRAAALFGAALTDLMAILQGPETLISLRGSLGLQYGTGGRPGVAAHYAPATRTFALAKNAGPGSIAHEWFHAFDHYICSKAFAVRVPGLFASRAWLDDTPALAHPLNERLVAGVPGRNAGCQRRRTQPPVPAFRTARTGRRVRCTSASRKNSVPVPSRRSSRMPPSRTASWSPAPWPRRMPAWACIPRARSGSASTRPSGRTSRPSVARCGASRRPIPRRIDPGHWAWRANAGMLRIQSPAGYGLPATRQREDTVAVSQDKRGLGSGLRERWNRVQDRTVRIAVTGLSQSGKTNFITSVVNQLLHPARLPRFVRPDSGEKIEILGTALMQLPDMRIPPFPYHDHMESLRSARPAWPLPTDRLRGVRVGVRYRSRNLLKQDTDRLLYVDLLDYPGEWLLDLPLTGWSFADWSERHPCPVPARAPGRAWPGTGSPRRRTWTPRPRSAPTRSPACSRCTGSIPTSCAGARTTPTA